MWTEEFTALVRRTECATLSNDEFAQFRHVCEAVELDPLRKQIYAQKRGGKLVIITGIDGFRLVARRDGLAGIDDAAFIEDEKGKPTSATVTVHRWGPKTQKESYTATARWAEYNAGGGMWSKMPHTMLGKCAEALALRKGFQALSGLYTDDEMAQADRDQKPAARSKPEPKPGPVAQVRARFGELLRERIEALDVAGFGTVPWKQVACLATGLAEWPDAPQVDLLERAVSFLENATDYELMNAGEAKESVPA